MELLKAVRGAADILPGESHRWAHVEQKAMDTARLFGYKPLRTPVFEQTELFSRSVGDTTDVVQKEMYTFDDKGGRSITLRPEGTAGVVRAFLEHGLYNQPMPVKASYVCSCYRYEKPQAGRLREFHQFGAECFGSADPTADSELISLAHSILTGLGLNDLSLEINSIGCPACRSGYHTALKEYFSQREDQLCETCKGRLDRNPMRILDCKSPVCSKIAEEAPLILDYICEDCRNHFEKLKASLDSIGLKYTVNPKIVRGLDYYTRTVFEFISKDIGAQGTLCGGGRYDRLVETLGGPSTPALGFAMGLERILLALQNTGADFPEPARCDVYIASMGEKAARKAAILATRLRNEGFHAETDIVGRSLKAQMKYAGKIGAKSTVVIGDNELEAGKAELKNMDTGEKTTVGLNTGLIEAIYNQNIKSTLGAIEATFNHSVKDSDTGRIINPTLNLEVGHGNKQD